MPWVFSVWQKTTRKENILHASDCEYIQKWIRILLKRVKLQKTLKQNLKIDLTVIRVKPFSWGRKKVKSFKKIVIVEPTYIIMFYNRIKNLTKHIAQFRVCYFLRKERFIKENELSNIRILRVKSCKLHAANTACLWILGCVQMQV